MKLTAATSSQRSIMRIWVRARPHCSTANVSRLSSSVSGAAPWIAPMRSETASGSSWLISRSLAAPCVTVRGWPGSRGVPGPRPGPWVRPWDFASAYFAARAWGVRACPPLRRSAIHAPWVLLGQSSSGRSRARSPSLLTSQPVRDSIVHGTASARGASSLFAPRKQDQAEKAPYVGQPVTYGTACQPTFR